MTDAKRVKLSTGVTLNVVEAGPKTGEPLILLHGFPESHRTWRGIAPALAEKFRLIMPDQRGFGASDLPQQVADYRPGKLTADIVALADALGLNQFALAGHDWGGAIAWAAAQAHCDRINRLIVINSPHPWVFQKTLIDDPAQRAASQYMNIFRKAETEAMIEWKGFDWFFERSFAPHVDLAIISEDERAGYIKDWSRKGALTAMLNWYRATGLKVPLPDADMTEPTWMAAFPKLTVPTLVIWGMLDPALLPIQLDALGDWVDDLTIVRLADAGHFAPWQAPDEVAKAMLDFLCA